VGAQALQHVISLGTVGGPGPEMGRYRPPHGVYRYGVSVTLTDGSGMARFYQRFGFRVGKDIAQVWERETEAISNDADNAR